ncbi:MAG: hypothetical protein U1D55_04110 [Phycisphaerae bacterium]
MATHNPDTMTQMFRQTGDAFQSFWNAGLQMQQDAFRALGTPAEPMQPEAVRGRMHKVADATVNLVDKNSDQGRRLVEEQTRETFDLLKKNVDLLTPGDKFDAFEAGRTAFNNVLQTTGTVVRNAMNAGTTMLENWSEFATQTATDTRETTRETRKTRATK